MLDHLETIVASIRPARLPLWAGLYGGYMVNAVLGRLS